MRQTLFSYFQLIRAANIFTVISNIVAAFVISSNGDVGWQIIPLLVVSVCLYHGGMALNDCIDVEDDRINNANRPIPSARLKLTNAWLLVLTLFLIAMITASFLPFQTFVVAIILLLLIIMYDVFVKDGIPGSVVMGSCRYVNWLLPFSLFPLALKSFVLPIPVFLYVTGLTVLSKEEHRGNNRVVLTICTLLVFAALTAICLYSFRNHSLTWYVLPIVLLFFGWIASSIYRCYLSFTAENIQKLMKTLILGIIPLDAALVASQGYIIASLSLLILLPISLQTAKRIYVT